MDGKYYLKEFDTLAIHFKKEKLLLNLVNNNLTTPIPTNNYDMLSIGPPVTMTVKDQGQLPEQHGDLQVR